MKKFITKFVEKFMADDTTTLAASLAFYAALSLAPIMILFLSVSASLSMDLKLSFIEQMRRLAGEDAAEALQLVVSGVSASEPRINSVASAAGLVTVLISASMVFGQLRYTFSRIFSQEQAGSAASYFGMAAEFVKERALRISLALFSIFVMIASVYVSAFLYSNMHTDEVIVKAVVSFSVSVAIYVALFTLLFRFLPERGLSWADAIEGGALTAIMFALGKELIAVYLTQSRIGSFYGSAGSIIVLLVWVYYSSLITLIGAQVIAVLHNRRNGRH